MEELDDLLACHSNVGHIITSEASSLIMREC
jgi:hypothetical protein